MRTGYSTLSADPSWKVLADSSPYCLFRNKENYHFQSGHVLPKSGGSGASNQNARQASSSSYKGIDDQVRLYNDSLADSYIPSYLLYGALHNDAVTMQECKQEQSRSSLAVVHHNRRSLFVHVSGRNMDQLVLRHTKHSYVGEDLRNPPGFTLPLGQGSSIHEIHSAGSTNYGYSSLMLARTRSEVFQLRTVSLEDRKGKSNDPAIAVDDNVMSTIMEPVQKWQLPYEICSMSTAPGSWQNAVMLTTCGRVATWNPTDGVLLVSSSASQRALPAQSLAAGMRDYSMRIDCTLHPQLSHIVCDKSVHLFDVRAGSTAATILYTATGHRVRCSKQHGSEGHCFMVSTKNCVSLIDTRFAKAPLAQQYIPTGHERMRYFANPLDATRGLFVGASRGSAQLLAHSLEKCGASQSDVQESAQQLLSAARPSGYEGCVRWDVDGFPLVDNSGSAEQSLAGFDLINLPEEMEHDGSSSGSESEEEEDSMGGNGSESESDSSHLPSRQHRRIHTTRTPKTRTIRTCAKALLLQQSHRGDVFAQRVTWGVNPFRQARLGLLPAGPIGGGQTKASVTGLSASTASAVASAVARKAPARKQQKRKRPAHYLDSDDEEEEDEEESEEEVRVDLLRNAATAQAAVDLLSQESRGLPPVQLNLPCGVRCFASESAHTNASGFPSGRDKKESALKATKKYLKTVIRNNGLILQNAISVSDFNPSVDKQQAFRYPSGSAAFPDFVPEDSLHGFDLIKMYPEDLRSDLPVLPSHTTIMMKQSSPAVTARSAVDYIVQHYQKEVRGYLEKEAKTLWEIWRFLLGLTDGKRLDINQVRQNLRAANYGLIETIVPTCSGGSVSDTKEPTTKSDDIHSGSDSDAENSDDSDHSLASSGLDLGVANHEKSKNKSVEAIQRPRPRTFDGLYVREPCVDGSNLETYRDTSKGREVRMSRRKDSSGDATASEKNAVSAGSLRAARQCSCSVANLQSIDLAALTLCGEKSCLLPHMLVYRVAKSTDSAVGAESSNSNTNSNTGTAAGLPPRGRIPVGKSSTTSAKPKAEVFYWGSSLAPVTVPVVVSSESQKTQPQSQSQSQPMSQLRFHLSQFSQASQPPSSLSNPMSQETPRPLSQTPAPAARTPASLPEVNLDVTDNILAVLGNQWNRSLDHTAFIDPARSSLVQAFLPT